MVALGLTDVKEVIMGLIEVLMGSRASKGVWLELL
jgi:hypothetical protein